MGGKAHAWLAGVAMRFYATEITRREEGTLEGRSETWAGRYHVQRRANPTISMVQSCNEPRRREGLQVAVNGLANRLRVRNHEHEEES